MVVTQPTIEFADGREIPQVGLGVWQTPNETADAAVQAALNGGYRHIDTASVYENEEGVGKGINGSDVAREDIFLTTKLWNDTQGYDSALKGFDASLKRLGTDYVDLYLIHWPSPHRGLYLETWKSFIKLKEEGRAKSIGVSNFCAEHLEKIIGETGVKPVLNQIELHPDFQQKELRAFHGKHGIVTQSWSPLGQGGLLDQADIAKIASKHGRSTAQIIIRWHIQQGLVVIPKSVHPDRIKQNFQVFDFELDEQDLARMAKLDGPDNRVGPDPMLAAF
ncbi:MAG: aldo/keto reductase [Roseibium sp.]